jgi:hypothetical protein
MRTRNPVFDIYRESHYLDLASIFAFSLITTQNLPLSDDRILF